MSVQACSNPVNALLNRYDCQGGYTDCYTLVVPGEVSLASFVNTFYTTWVFKLERIILALFVAKPSTDEDAKRLAEGQAKKFAAWTMEARVDDQLLMCDFQSKTRSFFMVLPELKNTCNEDEKVMTRLYFGSAIVATEKSKQGDPTLSLFFKTLVGFHKFYSRILLAAAQKKLIKKLAKSQTSG